MIEAILKTLVIYKHIYLNMRLNDMQTCTYKGYALNKGKTVAYRHRYERCHVIHNYMHFEHQCGIYPPQRENVAIMYCR